MIAVHAQFWDSLDGPKIDRRSPDRIFRGKQREHEIRLKYTQQEEVEIRQKMLRLKKGEAFVIVAMLERSFTREYLRSWSVR